MLIPTTRVALQQVPAASSRISLAEPRSASHLPRRRQGARLRVQAQDGLLGRLGQFWAPPQAAEPPAPAEEASGGAFVDDSPAPTDVFAQPLPGDGEDVALLRQLLAETQLEQAPLQLAYDAEVSRLSVHDPCSRY
jgi:hypothetical protein